MFTTVGLPIASVGGLALGGINSINAMNQQNTLDDNQNQIESLENDLTAVQARTSSLESKTSTLQTSTSGLADLAAKVTTLETKMGNVGFSLTNLCLTLENIYTPGSTTDQYRCCANSDWGKLYCATPSAADLFGIANNNAPSTSPTCDVTNAATVCQNG